ESLSIGFLFPRSTSASLSLLSTVRRYLISIGRVLAALSASVDMFSGFLLGRLCPPRDPTESLAGKTIILTGGNTGLGFEAAIKYVNLGAKSLIIGCRNLERGNKAKEVIERRTKRPGVVQI